MEKYFQEINCKIDNVYEKHYDPNIYKKSEIKYINIDYDNNGHQGLFNKLLYLSGLVRFCSKYVNVRIVEPIYKIGIEHHSYSILILFLCEKFSSLSFHY